MGKETILYYQSKYTRLSGSNYKDVLGEARSIYAFYSKRTKRIPYLRSKYYGGDKIFINVFWTHIMQKRINERTRRLKFYNCALDLIRNGRIHPIVKPNPNNKNEILYRFYGKSFDGCIFFIQIKENIKTGNKYLMSIVVPKS